MKNIIKTAIFLIVLASLPIAAQAMDHKAKNSDMDHSKMDHGDMDKSQMDHSKMDRGDMDKSQMDHSKMDHGGMSMQGDMVMLGNSVQDGVKAMAHLKDVKATMAKMGMDATHHIMVMFADVNSGEAIESGAAAVKIKGPDGEESKAINLIGMEGHFGADIELTEPGDYHFTVGTRLADGNKRQFEFDYTLK